MRCVACKYRISVLDHAAGRHSPVLPCLIVAVCAPRHCRPELALRSAMPGCPADAGRPWQPPRPRAVGRSPLSRVLASRIACIHPCRFCSLAVNVISYTPLFGIPNFLYCGSPFDDGCDLHSVYDGCWSSSFWAEVGSIRLPCVRG